MPKPEQIKKVPSKLILPHPRIQDRGFVLKPLMDIAQDWRHPVCGLTVSQMYANLSIDERAGILLAFEN
jgi:2-amino-4-hydroxy-6-hydroxymethyldihydropteridine diphosphokinase